MNLKKAAEAQRRLSSKLNLKWDGREVYLIAGADFGYGYKEKKIGASIVVFKIPEPLREAHRRTSKIFQV
jgi:deoxyinosine 3'endonuclease (endonuclease V)